MKDTMLPSAVLTELRQQAHVAASQKRIRFVEIDPRVLGQLIDELENHRLVNLTIPREQREPALRD